MEIRPLQETDDRRGFTSGDPELDRFFLKYAGQNQFRHHIGTTYVAVEDVQILGFATLSPGHLEVKDLPQALSKQLPRYPLPILRLARLAVAQHMQGKGIGSALLFAVFQLALSQAQSVGCIGVVVDAKQDAIAWYQRYGFTELAVFEGESRSRPAPTPMFLAIAAIQAASN